MITQFITIEIDIQASPADMRQAIEAALHHWGEPLRWAITSIKPEEHKAVIEAIVTKAAAG